LAGFGSSDVGTGVGVTVTFVGSGTGVGTVDFVNSGNGVREFLEDSGMGVHCILGDSATGSRSSLGDSWTGMFGIVLFRTGFGVESRMSDATAIGLCGGLICTDSLTFSAPPKLALLVGDFNRDFVLIFSVDYARGFRPVDTDRFSFFVGDGISFEAVNFISGAIIVYLSCNYRTYDLSSFIDASFSLTESTAPFTLDISG
jgi:hypothetical protein